MTSDTTGQIQGKHVLMIDNYDSFTWNLYQFLCQLRYSAKVSVFRNDAITIQDIETKIKPDIIFILPGPGHPKTDLGILKDIVSHFKGKLPIVGVCMGQQVIFEVFGGDVEYAGEIVHGKTTSIKHDGKGMFAGVPQSVAVTRYHSLAGTIKTLPDTLEVTAMTETSPEVIMGVRHKEYVIEGVQFHPELILTELGQLMIDNLLTYEGGYWKDQVSSSPGSNSKPKDILSTIYEKRQNDYKSIELLPGKSFADLEQSLELGLAPSLINFFDRLVSAKTPILAEFKRASPSKGDINTKLHPGVQAKTYASNGCAAISVLTEPNWFKGSIEDLATVRKVVENIENRPAVLRKEFVFNKYQILEARLAGADTVLLIVKMLKNPKLLQELYLYSHLLGMVPLVEVNDEPELSSALLLNLNGSTTEPLIIGVNNRNLQTFDVDLNTTSLLVSQAKSSKRAGEVLVLALLGITSAEDVHKYKYEDKVDGFLIGESLMRAEAAGHIKEYLKDLTSQ